MNKLVRLEHGVVLTDTKLVADIFGIRHSKVMQIVDRLLVKLSKIKGASGGTLKIEKRAYEYRGQTFEMYVLNRQAFSLLSMRFESDRALEWQVKFNDAFYMLEESLLRARTNRNSEEWLTVRQQGKVSRKKETDVIKQFVEYATTQGSKSANFYYKHFTTATYQPLNLMVQKKPKLRDTLNFMELNQIVLAEAIVGRSLSKYMSEGEHYKVIFEKVKNDIEKFANTLMLPKLENK